MSRSPRNPLAPAQSLPFSDEFGEGLGLLNISLAERQLERLRVFYSEIVWQNARVNLTRIVDWREAQTLHFLDSLSACLALPPELLEGEGSVVDIGAGAGFPGVPLKIAFPRLRLTLLEATAKKAEFLQRVIAKLELDEATVEHMRSEDAARSPRHRASYDAALARGVAPLPTLVELAIPLCVVGGRLVAHKGPALEAERKAATAAMRRLRAEFAEAKQIDLTGLPRRWLAIVEKVDETPPRYPRRAGLPAKRPLLT